MRGTARERRPGVWEVQVELPRVDGQRRFRTRTIHGTEADADLARAQLVAELDHGTAPTATDTVAAWLTEWVDSNEARGRWRPSTTRKHRENTARLPAGLASAKLARVRPVDIDRAYASLSRRFSPAVVRGVHATLRGALRDAARLGLIHMVPTEGARLPAITPGGQEAPTTEQVHAMLDALADDPMWHAFFRLAAATGARPSEVSALRWGDLDGDRVTIRDVARLADSRGRAVTTTRGTKTGRARTVTIDPTAVAALTAWRTRRVEVHLRHGIPLNRRTLIFPARRRPDTDVPYSPGAASQRWRRVWLSLGLDDRDVPLYGLRHWHASSLLRAGVPVPEVARRLGHASPVMTLNVYGHHVTDQHDLGAVAVTRLLGGISP